MLRLSKLTDYAVVILATLAGDGASPQTAAATAQQSGLAQPTVAKILKKLAKSGIVRASRGIRGGYQLTRPPATITVADIVTAMDGPIALTDCVDGRSGHCNIEHNCSLRGHWNPVNCAIHRALESVSLADMARPAVAAVTILQPTG